MNRHHHLLTDAEHQEINAAVSKAELRTDGEIVTIIARASDDYRQTPFIWAIAILFIFLSSLAIFPGYYLGMTRILTGGWEYDLSASFYMSLVLSASVIIFASVYLFVSFWPLRMVLTPKYYQAERSRIRAISLFRVGAERRTMGLTGILIYLSLAEHRAEIIADEAIVAKVSPEIWGEAMEAMLAEVALGHMGSGMARAVEKVGEVLAVHFPKSDGNFNELPDRLIEI